LRTSRYHISTVKAEAHEPGPGRRNPDPAKVATDHAQNVRVETGLVVPVAFIGWAVGIIFASFVHLRFVHIAGGFLEQFRIKDRRADLIRPASPFAKVYEATTIAAKWEVLVTAEYNRPAGRTTKTDYLFPGHNNTRLKDARHQIIVV